VKVVLIGPVYPYRGGIAHYTTMLYRALRERGHEVLVVSFKRQYPQWLFPGRSDKDPSERPLKVEGARYWIDSLNPITWLTTFQRIYHYQPDTIVFQWWTTFWAPMLFVLGGLNRLFLQKPIMYICHNVLPHESQPWDSWLARLAWQWGTQFIVQSPEEKKRLLDLMPDTHVDVVSHPVYDMFADQQISQREARQRLGLPQDKTILLFFGFVRKYKGLQNFLTALPEVKAQIGQVILLVVGEFWEDKSPYLEIIKDLKITDSVILEDRYVPNEEVPLYFSAADALVAPYRRSTGSGVIQIAHSFGMPVIKSSVAEIDEEGSKKQDSLNKKEWGEAVAKFTRNKDSKSVGARQKARATSSWQELVDVLEIT
jgi:glycosyltransferase involved in cell wall biosynthesis